MNPNGGRPREIQKSRVRKPVIKYDVGLCEQPRASQSDQIPAPRTGAHQSD
jgi:hypothetical protein